MFDLVIGNPPYQKQVGPRKTQAIWQLFVSKAFELVKEDGYVSLIHPSSWRNVSGMFKKTQLLLTSKQLEYLEIHSEQDGCKTFGASTRYDWYVAKNTNPTKITLIKDQEGNITKNNLKDISFIPNSQIDYVYSLLAKDGEPTVETLHSSAFHTQKSCVMSQHKINDFIHPVIYSVAIKGPTFWYTNDNTRGHFGIPKIVVNPCRPIGYVLDSNGEYGLSQFCVGIVGDDAYLKTVEEVIKNQKSNGFAEFMETCHLTDKIFNKDIISLFRKDFWKDFI